MPISFNELVNNAPLKTTLDLTDQLYIRDGGSDMKTTFQNLIGNTNFISVTHTELSTLVSASSLIPGQQYTISDYRTTYYMPNVTPPELMSGSVEPLVVMAASVNTLYPEAKSVQYPNDIIYYSVENDQAKQAGCTKGYIFRRIDTVNKITVGLDWRKVKFRRWKVNVTAEWDTGTTYAKYALVKKTGTDELYFSMRASNTNNALTLTTHWARCAYDNGSIVIPWSTGWVGNWTAAISIPADSTVHQDYYIFTKKGTTNFVDEGMLYDITFEDNIGDIVSNFNSVFFIQLEMFQAKFGSLFKENTTSIENSSRRNDVGREHQKNLRNLDHFSDNLVGYMSISGIWRGTFNNNEIRQEFNQNILANGFWNNRIGVSSFDNIFQHASNNFSKHSLINCTFGHNCINNNFLDGIGNLNVGTDCANNTTQWAFGGSGVTPMNVGNNCNNNFIQYMYRCTVGDNFRFCRVSAKVLDTNFSSATIVYGDYPKEIIKNSSGVLKVQYTNGSDVVTTAAVTT